MAETSDNSLLITALRESSEEIGLPPEKVQIVGELNQVISKYRIKVSPFVGLTKPDVMLLPCPKELDSIFYVPLAFFLESTPDRVDRFEFSGEKVSVPSWYFKDYEIWGLSAYVIANFLNIVFNIRYQ